MTPRDRMPFGKHGLAGLTIGDVKTKEPAYCAWLLQQDWFAPKYPQLAAFFRSTNVSEMATPAEAKNISGEVELMAGMPLAFKDFWRVSYGERMRVHGELNYLAYLRVAVTTWKAYDRLVHDPKNCPPSTPTKMLPPPFSHIPAPNLAPKSPSVLEADLKGIEPTPDEDDPTDVEENKESEEEARLRAQGLDKDGAPLF